MRNFLVYALLGIALWYLARAALRHYLTPPHHGNRRMPESNADRSADAGAGNYQSARDAKYRDVE